MVFKEYLKKMVITKKDLIWASIVFVLLIIIAYPYIKADKAIKKNGINIAKSEGKVQVLDSNLVSINKELELIRGQRDSMINLSHQEPKKQVIIKTKYNAKKLNNLSHSLDSSIAYSSRWISKADTL